MEFHEVCDLFPMMSDEEYAGLKADIAAHGQIEPIWTYQGKVIDGRNRYRVCRDLGIEPATREWSGEGDLTAFVVGLNLHRRHLDTSQRGMISARLKPRFEAAARARQEASQFTESNPTVVANLPPPSDPVPGKSRDRAAELLNVSARTVEHACRVLEKGTPALIRAVDAGDVKVSAASLLTDLPAEEQDEIVAEGKEAVRERAREILRERPPADPTLAQAERFRAKFLESIHHVDDLTRAVAAREQDGGYGGFPAVLALVGRRDFVRLRGKVETLIERLQRWLSQMEAVPDE